MWIERDFCPSSDLRAHPVKVLKGPRQVGKTALLLRAGTHRPLYLDDHAARELALRDPRFFLDQWREPLLLDEATLAPPLFFELKRRVDGARRGELPEVDVWITGSNQTLLHRNVRESLAGRASYFDLNTLSVHELARAGSFRLEDYLLRGGWPELYRDPTLDPVRYLNDLLATFVERDIVLAAGIERREALGLVLRLVAARVAQLWNASDVARNAGVEVTTVQSWCRLLEENGLLRRVAPFHSNLNQRLIKAPKFYFEDVGLAVRLQGWTSYEPLLLSPVMGSLFENLVLSEITRWFHARGARSEVDLVRTKDGVEVDFLVQLGNGRAVAIEAKSSFEGFTPAQHRVLDSLGLELVGRWTVVRGSLPPLGEGSVAFGIDELFERLEAVR